MEDTSKIFNITHLFNFDEIYSDYHINSKLSKNECFLAKKAQLKSIGIIEREGDILYGIKNNESCTIKVTIYYNLCPNYTKEFYDETSKIYDVCIINSGETYILKCPILLIKLYKLNRFSYEVEKIPNLKPDSDSNSTNYLSMLYNHFFKNKPTHSIVNIEFIYGYLTTELRNVLVHSKCYVDSNHRLPREVCRNKVYEGNICIGPYLYNVANGTVYDGIRSYTFINTYLIPLEYYELYFNNKTSSNETEFKKEFFSIDKDWVEFK